MQLIADAKKTDVHEKIIKDFPDAELIEVENNESKTDD